MLQVEEFHSLDAAQPVISATQILGSLVGQSWQ